MTRTWRVFLPALLAGTLLGPEARSEPAAPAGQELEARTAEIARRYLQNWSADTDGGVEEVGYTYGPTIRFYGRSYTRAELAAEKRRAVRLWPVRRYAHRPGSMRITCNRERLRCASSSIIDYEVRNPARGRSARGSTTLDLGVGFADGRPTILYESGKIRGRDPSG